MLKLAYHLSELRFDELAALYHYDITVPDFDEYIEEPDEEWFLTMKAEFSVFLCSRFFGKGQVRPDARPFYAMWEVDGHYVSAVRVDVYEQGLLLEDLYTGPEFRGRGYASELLDAVLGHLAEMGHFSLYAQVKDYKKADRELLEKAGFVKILDHAVRKDPCEWPPYYYRVDGSLTLLKKL